jgi:ribosomal protein S18 acetylase RimI-like enzyme
MGEIQVRPYTQGDRDALHRIAGDTAFFGAPAEAFLDDRRLFCDIFYAYYTDLEPEHAWVAAAGSQVVGFIVGSTDTRLQERRWRREVLPRIWNRTLRGGYRLGHRTGGYVWRGLGALLRGEVPHVDLEAYPAHLHINVDEHWRGRGLGRRLIDAYLGRLRALGVPGVHLNTTSLNEAACYLYEKVGFRLLDARATQMWAAHIQRVVENRCYGLRFD